MAKIIRESTPHYNITKVQFGISATLILDQDLAEQLHEIIVTGATGIIEDETGTPYVTSVEGDGLHFDGSMYGDYRIADSGLLLEALKDQLGY